MGRITRFLGTTALAVLCTVPMAHNGQAEPPPFESNTYYDQPERRAVEIGVGRSKVIELSEPARDAYVADTKIASVATPTSRRLVISGLEDGSTTVIVNAADGRQIAVVEVRVARDTARLSDTLRAALPNTRINARAAGDTIILSGSVQTAADAARAVDIAGGFVGSPDKVVNALTLQAQEQVMLRVTVAEVQRNVLKQFGVNAAGEWQVGDIVLGGVMSNPWGVAGKAISDTIGNISSENGTATIQAMAQIGVARVLAEPVLTAASGENATFVVGGEVPVPTGLTCSSNNTCQPSIEFKKFGVSLGFTPVVLSGGRINMRVTTEISEIDNQNQLSYGTGSGQITIPGFKVRKQQTTVELPSGGTLMTAGLIQEGSRQAVTGIPGAMDIPVLGTLFRSRDYQRQETELVITVTPILARPMEARQAVRPDAGFADAPDPRAILFGQVNRVIGDPKHKVDPANFFGHLGYIID